MILALALLARLVATPTPEPPVKTADKTWMDPKAARYVKAQIFWRDDAKRMPVILISADIGTNREGYDPLARTWAAAGFLVTVVTHPSGGCGATNYQARVSKDGMTVRNEPGTREELAAARIALSEDEARNAERDRDLAIVLDKLDGIAKNDSTLKGRLDMSSVGTLGHGLASRTALRLAGYGGHALDPRVKAIAVLSSDPAVDWKNLDAPSFETPASLLFLSDGAPIASHPYEKSHASASFKVEASSTLAFRVAQPADCDDPANFRIPEWAAQETIAFWKATLLGDAEARSWLRDAKAAPACGKDCRFESN